jgi:hypothetical protein
VGFEGDIRMPVDADLKTSKPEDKVGLIVNPVAGVAGMGGRVGLKATDGQMQRKALEPGVRSVPRSGGRSFGTEPVGTSISPKKGAPMMRAWIYPIFRQARYRR